MPVMTLYPIFQYYVIHVKRVLTSNFGKMLLKYLGESVRLKDYPRTIRHMKSLFGPGRFVYCFVLKRPL